MAGIPDGSYALFRSDENKVELITDVVGSRTIWYVRTEDAFIASTSQRAIIFFSSGFSAKRRGVFVDVVFRDFGARTFLGQEDTWFGGECSPDS